MIHRSHRPLEGATPLFEMDDPVIFPVEDAPPEGVDKETWAYWQTVDQKVQVRGVGYNDARRETGWPPDWPRGANLARAVLNGTFDPKAL